MVQQKYRRYDISQSYKNKEVVLRKDNLFVLYH